MNNTLHELRPDLNKLAADLKTWLQPSWIKLSVCGYMARLELQMHMAQGMVRDPER